MIKHFNAERFRQFQNDAIDKRNCGGAVQREILESAKNLAGADFVHWLEQKIGSYEADGPVVVGDAEPELPAEIFTAQMFKNLPQKTADSAWEIWRDMETDAACSSSVWGYIVSRMILHGKIKPHYCMVGSNGGKSDGLAEIDNALNAKGELRKKQCDACVRAFLRRLSGLYERGARSVYENCPPARSWWQYKIAGQSAENTGIARDDIIELFGDVWGVLVEKMASRLTVIGDENIRDGLIKFLIGGGGEYRSNKTLNALIKNIGVMAAWRGLGMFPPEEVSEIIGKEIIPSIPKGQAE